MNWIRRYYVPLALAFLLAIALGLRLFHLGSAEFWADERMSFEQEEGGPLVQSDIGKVPKITGDLPGYHILMKLFYLGGWEAPYTAVDRRNTRLLSTLAGVAAVFLIFLLIKSVSDRNSAFIAATLLTFSIYAVYYSQEHRPYALWVAWSILTTWLFVIVFFQRRLRLAPLFGVVLGALLYIHYASIFLPVIYLITFGVVAIFRLRLPDPNQVNPTPIGRRDLYAGLVVVAVAFLVFLPIRSHYWNLVSDPFKYSPIVDSFSVALVEQFSEASVFLKVKTELWYAALVHFGAGRYLSLSTYGPLVLLGWLGMWDKNRPAAVLFTSFYFVPFVFTTFTIISNVFQLRHLMFLFPIHQGLAAYGIVTFVRLSSNQWIKWMLVLALVACLLSQNIEGLIYYYADSVKCDSMHNITFCQTYIDMINDQAVLD